MCNRRGERGKGGGRPPPRGTISAAAQSALPHAPPLIISRLCPPPTLSTSVSSHRTLQPFAGASPSLGDGAFVAPGASVIGDVTLGARASVWYNAVIRGERE